MDDDECFHDAIEEPHGGYTYWKRKCDAPLVAEPPKEIAASSCEGQKSSPIAASAWNAAGTTWEERDVSQRVRDEIARTFKGLKIKNKLIIERVRIDSCESTIIYSRGVPRFGYEISMEIYFESGSTVHVTNLADHEDSPDICGATKDECNDIGTWTKNQMKEVEKAILTSF